MEEKRKSIEKTLNLIREKLINKRNNNLAYEDLTFEINQLQGIAIEELKSNDELLKEIESTKQIITDREME
ncbi:hypothetical protein QA597_10655 [Marinilabiliaceae bacterium ANBcel2]|nr:hypothetical protein [Marinilabiliaceae bacterium ANBcel2]